MKQSATLISLGCRRMFPRCKSKVRNFLTMLFLLSGMFFVTQKTDAQCNSFGVDFKQGANRDNFGSYTTGELHWINSILQQSNSRYIEGMSTMQRVVFDNLPSCGGNHILRIKMETRKGDVHAYDFITSWDNALKAAAAIAPGFGLMPSSRSDPKLHECDEAISSCAEDVCNLVTGGGDGVGTGDIFRDLPVIFNSFNFPDGPGEENLLIDDGTAVDQNSTRQVIETYECRYGDNITIPAGLEYAGEYDRSVRVYVEGGFLGANGDANNAVLFVGYGDANPNDGGDTYIYYDIMWSSTSTSVVLEFAAHIAVGVDGLANINPPPADNPAGAGCNVSGLGVGYLLNRGASSISGGPYHVILEDFQDAPGNTPNCEPNLGNQDNQLQGSEILLIPKCELQGPSTVCANAVAVYNATVTNPDNATNANNSTYLWEIINSSQSPPPASIVGAASGNVPQVPAGETSVPLSINVNTGGIGTYTVKLTITNGAATTTTDDDITSSCTVTTTVSGGPSITCPSSSTVAACLTQAQVDAAYVAWLGTVSAGATHNGGTTGPNRCGGTTTVTFTATNTCGSATCTASFTVTNAPAVTLNCASNSTIPACQTQEQVNAAYAAWLLTATASGGCGLGPVTNNQPTAPLACGGFRDVTFSVTSSCEGVKTCSARFTVTNAPAVTLNCAANTTVPSCQTQTQVNAAYAAWLQTATASGGCGLGPVTNNQPTAPLACGGFRDVTFTVTSSCEAPKTCSARFTVTTDITAPVFTFCPANVTTECDVTPVFGVPTASDCMGIQTITTVGPDVTTGTCPTVYTRTWRATDNCGNTATCSQSITVPCCVANCTYTQGAYGTEGGKMCDGTNGGYSTEDFIELILGNLGGSLTVGCAGHSVTVSAGDANCVIDKLPGGGSSGPIPAGDHNLCTLPGSMLKNGRINNALLAQTITLGLNMGIQSGTLGNFALQPNQWLVTADLEECGSTDAKECTFNCVPDPINIGQYIWTVASTPYHVSDCKITQAVYDALTTKNVSGLYALANSALCGNALPAGVTYSDITNAVDCINNAFDECRAFTAWVPGAKPTPQSFCTLPSSTTPCPVPVTRITRPGIPEVVEQSASLSVSAYPNPFTDKVSFVIKSKVSGPASLEVYNMLGQKMQTVYTGTIVADRSQIIEYRVSKSFNGGLIYIFKQGGKQVTGKLVNIE